MSYHRKRRGLSGVTSLAPGRPVHTHALGAYVAPRLIPGPKMVPDWYRAKEGTSLSGDTLDADQQWREQMLDGQRQLIAAQKVWAKGDETQKWLQIGVTAAIPVFAALWRALGIGRRNTTPT